MSTLKIIVNILDDDEIALLVIKEMFKNEDIYSIECFTNPDEFKGSFNKDVDLFITDIRIPNYDAVETLKTISKVNPTCYLVAMSAYLDVAIMKELIYIGVAAAIEKNGSHWVEDLKSEVTRLKPKLELKARIRNDYR